MATLSLTIDNHKTADVQGVDQNGTTLGTSNGYLSLVMNSWDQVCVDSPADDVPYNYNPPVVSPPGDNNGVLTVDFGRTPGGLNQQPPILQQTLPKLSGKRTFSKKLFLFAVNNGKVDGNSQKVSCLGMSGYRLLNVGLSKNPQAPTDDKITGTFDYTLNWVFP